MKIINRQIFENALKSMEVYGLDGMSSPRILAKRNIIKDALIRYYESTEEFEKCKYIVGFFEDLEKEIESTNQDKKQTRSKKNSSSQKS